VNDKKNVLIVDGMSALQCNAVRVFVVLLEGHLCISTAHAAYILLGTVRLFEKNWSC